MTRETLLSGKSRLSTSCALVVRVALGVECGGAAGAAGGASGTVGTVVVAPGAVAVVGRGSDAAWDHPDITPDAFYGTAVTLNNGGDELRLSNGGGELASVDWSDSEAGISWTLADSEWVLADTVADALPVSGEFATPGE